MRNKVIIISSIAFILLFFSSSAFFKKDKTVYSGNATSSFSVKIQECAPQNRTIYLNFSGTVNPLHRASLVPKISGKIIAIYLPDGEKVKRDDVVLKIEDYGRIEQAQKAKALLKQREI